MENDVPFGALPRRIGWLNELAFDLWWNWDDQACEVFRTLDDQLWNVTEHNPVLLLHLLTSARIAEAATDPAFLAKYDALIECVGVARSPTNTWWGRRAPAGVNAQGQ